MALEHCTDEDKRIIGEALRATVDGPFFPGAEFIALFSVTREQLAEIARSWPEVDDAIARVAEAIHNSLASLIGYPHRVVGLEWDRWLSVPRERLEDVLDRWRLPRSLFLCPACGTDLDFEPWRGRSPSYEICPCCGIQFGLDDFIPGEATERWRFHAEWRQRWIRGGMQRWSTDEQPPDWDPREQLKRVSDKES